MAQQALRREAAVVSETPRLAGISVFLPSHNEEANVERVVGGYVATLPAIANDYEVIVVNDGSRDRTGAIAAQLAAQNSHVKVVNHEVNRGYGGAVISGIRAATLPWVLLSDGDGQFDPADVAKLGSFTDRFDVICGRRVRRADNLLRRFNGKAWTMLVRVVLGVTISDIDCGFKLLRRELLVDMPLRARGAMISTELMARLQAKGARVCEVDVRHLPRLAGEQSGANFKVVARAFKELLQLASELRAERRGGSS
ncbi:MAG TPA: glycosyltransferase family 2 protein [Candidatus Binataceae bacterium]|nr:glycosyltransferase family 2 protein [Candidatus Binataceae bacterium]